MSSYLTMIEDLTKLIPYDQVKCIIIIIAMIPAGWAFNMLKNSQLRLITSLLFGICCQYYIYGISLMHIVVSSLVNLIIIKYCNPNKIHKISIFYNFGYNSAIGIYKLMNNSLEWSVDISICYMMTLDKFIALSFNIKDARTVENKNLTEIQKKYMVHDFSLLEYFSYIFFFPTSLCGPFIEFNDFLNFIYLEEEYSHIPSTILPSILHFFTGLFFYAIYTLLKGYSSPDLLLDDTGKYRSWDKVIFFMLGNCHAQKYVGGFCMTDSTVIASGFAYNGTPQKSNKGKEYDEWGKARMVKVKDLELVYKPSEFFHSWNVSQHVFLKRYIYFRMIKHDSTFKQKQFASSCVFLISALWHGFEPAYLLTFLNFYIFILLENQLVEVVDFKKINETKKSILINCSRIIVAFFWIPYLCFIFLCLDYRKLWNMMSTLHCCGTLILIISNILVFLYSKFITTRKNKKLA